MRNYVVLLLMVCALCQGQWCRFNGRLEGEQAVISVHLLKNAYVYKDSILVVCQDNPVSSLTFSQEGELEEGMQVLKQNFEMRCGFVQTPQFPVHLSIVYRGCHKEACFLPQTVHLDIDKNGTQLTTEVKNSSVSGDFAGFQELGRFTGYKDAESFCRWLREAEHPQNQEESLISRVWRQWGMWAMMALVLLMGCTLNLTPCVLPMIPVNLAIISGGKESSRLRRVVSAVMYSLGMALAYGGLGFVTVRSGVQFGQINNIWWFNALAAGLFVLLALAMFDCFSIDLSRFRQMRRGSSLLGVFLLGAMTAFLSGACVAPVLLSVLLFAMQLYGEGYSWAIALPFVMGAGMALPWPILAAGLATLPKPGAWMVRVRQALGVLILLMGLWYGWSAVTLIRGGVQHNRPGWYQQPLLAINEALQKDQLLLVEFYGDNCKSCVLMNAVLGENEVSSMLESYTKLSLNASESTLVNDFHVLGVPTYILLQKMKSDK